MDLGLSGDELGILRDARKGGRRVCSWPRSGCEASADREQFLSSFGGSNRHVVDYLTEVVLDSVDGDVRRFLLETSILRELSGPLCDAVTGREDSAAILDMLERSNLFVISLDDQRLWYRYHHLFGELLREQLTLTLPERVAGLHRAASGWFAGAGHLDEAIGHAIAAHDLEAAADLVVSGWASRVASGRLTTVLGWLETFPDGYVKHSAPLSVISAWVNGLLGHDAAARRSVEDMLAAGSPGPLPDGSSDRRARRRAVPLDVLADRRGRAPQRCPRRAGVPRRAAARRSRRLRRSRSGSRPSSAATTRRPAPNCSARPSSPQPSGPGSSWSMRWDSAPRSP